MKTKKLNSKHSLLLTITSSLILGSQSLFAISTTSTIQQSSCKYCHGEQYEKKALGKSKILRDLKKEDIQKALIGYKENRYGGQLKAVMEGQVSRYSEKELKSFELEIASSSLLAAPEWIDPPQENCTSNGGKLAEGGLCKANWDNATAICASLGAKLPTIEQLRKEVENCGGVVNDSGNNKNNQAYQSCYKNKGFSSAGGYWSSSPYVSDSSYAWLVLFSHGFDSPNYKSRSYFVRCAR